MLTLGQMSTKLEPPAPKSEVVTAEPRPVLSPRGRVAILLMGLAMFSWLFVTTAGRADIAIEGTLIFILPVLIAWCLAQSAATARLLRTGLAGANPPVERNGNALLWFGFVTVVGCVVLLERLQPMYFTQDDNLANGVVGMVCGGRSLLAGQLLEWNHCQYLGTPMASMSYWSLTYPFTYVAYLIAAYVLQNEWWTMEVYQVGHLLAAYFAIYAAARFAGLTKLTATLAAIAVTLSGSSLVMGRSWYATIPLNLWLPLMVIGVCQIWRGPVTWRWTVAQGLCMGLLFHVGYPQTWVYAMMTFLGCVILLWVLREIPFGRAIRVIPAQLIGVGIAAPLLIVLFSELSDSTVTRYGHGIGAGGFLGMILPYPLIQVPHPEGWGNRNLSTMGQMFYWGTVLPLVSVLGIGSIVALKQSRETLVNNFWLLVAIFWLAVALGFRSVFWTLMGFTPGFSNFSCAFKAQQFFNLFAALGAGLIIDRLLNSARFDPHVAKRWKRGLVTAVLCFTVYHCWMARSSFHDYGFTPYPQLPNELTALKDSQQRVYVVAADRPHDPTFPHSLNLSSATVYGIPAVGGYDPLVSYGDGTKQILANVEQLDDGWAIYGVRWVVVHASAFKLTEQERLTSDSRKGRERLKQVAATQKRLEKKNASVFATTPNITVYELPNPSPMAFVTQTRQALPITTNGDGAQISLPKAIVNQTEVTDVTINYARRPHIRAYADAKPMPVIADEYHRIRVSVPAGVEQIDIRYEPPWHWGALVGLCLVVCAVFGNRLCSHRSET